MKPIFFIVILFLAAFRSTAQDSIAKQKLKINEIAIIGIAPIIQLYNYSSNRDIIFSALKNDNALGDLINAGYTDSSSTTKLLKPRHPHFDAMGIGVKAIIYLQNKKSKLKLFIPISISYESHINTDYYVGKQDVKRIDTIFDSGEAVYLDSISTKVSSFRLQTENLYLQSGFNIESGNQYFRFSTGLNIGLGIGFVNNLHIVHEEYSFIRSTTLDSKYYQSTYEYTDDKLQKVKPIVTTRFLVPFCMKINLKKLKHVGFMAEISPGFEMNKIVKGNLLTRWMLFCSLGARYTF